MIKHIAFYRQLWALQVMSWVLIPQDTLMNIHQWALLIFWSLHSLPIQSPIPIIQATRSQLFFSKQEIRWENSPISDITKMALKHGCVVGVQRLLQGQTLLSLPKLWTHATWWWACMVLGWLTGFSNPKNTVMIHTVQLGRLESIANNDLGHVRQIWGWGTWSTV